MKQGNIHGILFKLLGHLSRYGDGVKNKKVAVQILTETTAFCLFYSVQTGSGPTQPPTHSTMGFLP